MPDHSPCGVYDPHAAHGQCPGVGASTPTRRMRSRSGRVIYVEGMSMTPPGPERSPVELSMMLDEFMEFVGSIPPDALRGRYRPLDLDENGQP